MSYKNIIFIFPILSGFFWASAGIFIRRLFSLGMDNITIISSRMMIAAIMFLIVILIHNKNLIKIKLKDLYIFAFAGVFGILLLNICYNETIKELSLSLAGILLSIAPIFVIILAGIIFKERITVKKIICVLLALTGCLFASGVLENNETMKWTYTGIIIGLLGAFFYSFYSIFSKLAMARGYDTLTITLYSLLVISIILIPFTDWKFCYNLVQDQGIEFIGFLLLNSLCSSMLPYLCYTIGIAHMDAGKVSILSSGEPIFATIFGAFLFSEIPTILCIIGVILVLSALILLSIPDKRSINKDS